MQFDRAAIVALGGLGLAGAVLFLAMRPDPKIEQAKTAIGRTLLDPYSAKFEDVRVVNSEVGTIVCGTVNAKNKIGGYVGARPFFLQCRL
jgi:hypothetical protein